MGLSKCYFSREQLFAKGRKFSQSLYNSQHNNSSVFDIRVNEKSSFLHPSLSISSKTCSILLGLAGGLPFPAACASVQATYNIMLWVLAGPRRLNVPAGHCCSSVASSEWTLGQSPRSREMTREMICVDYGICVYSVGASPCSNC